MSGHQHATIGDTVYFWFAANDTSGSGGDGASPLFDVREAGAAASAIPLLSGTPSLLSHANYPAGCHEIAVAATVGNGFAADDTFGVFCTLAVDSQNPSGFVGSCTLTPLAKTAALATAQTDLDTITGSDGATLATTQGNYAPSKAGDSMDVLSISGDTTAADNLELQYDTTGLTGDTFPSTQVQVGRLTSGTAAINTTAESFTKAGAEPETNTYTSTVDLDGTFHIVEDDSTSTDCYYQFDVGGNGVPVSVTWIGYAQSNNDSYTIWAYNYGGTAYEQIGTLSGFNGTTVITETFSLTNAHVGTGANLGKVRFRFLSSDGTAFATDRLLCSYAIVAQSVGYSNGAVWIDTTDGTAGTESYVNGVADNPSSSLANAITIATNVGLDRFISSADSAITFAEAHTNELWNGTGWTLALGGQDISGAHIHECQSVTGIGTSPTGEVHFISCEVGNVTVGNSHFIGSGFSGTLTAGTATDYFIINCYSQVAGAGAPTYTFTGNGASSNINVRGYKGGGTWNFDSDCTVSIEVQDGGTHAITTGGGSIEFRGKPKALTIAASTGDTTNAVLANAAPVTITGSAGTVNLYGLIGYVDVSGFTGGTVNLYGTFAGQSSSGGATITEQTGSVEFADIATILADTNELQSDDVPGLIAALNDIAASDVLTQVNAALDTAISELGVAAPTATPTLRTGLMLLYMALRNKTIVQTSGTDALEIHNNAGTLITKKLLTDDGSDYTEAEMS